MIESDSIHGESSPEAFNRTRIRLCREFEEQLNRASSLMIVANACVLWNAVHLSQVIKELREEGFDFKPDDLRHVSLYAFEHIIQYGQYFFNLKLRRRKDAFSEAHELWTDRPLPC